MIRITSGLLKGRKLAFKFQERPRPTTGLIKNAIFNVLGDFIKDKKFLDLFGGTGAVGFEAISRGAESVIFIENDIKLIYSLKDNIKLFKVKGEVFAGHYLKQLINLKRKKQQFDVIFIDPPYFSGFVDSAVVTCMKYGLLAENGVVIVEKHDKTKNITEELLRPFYLSLIDSRKYGKTMVDFYEKTDPSEVAETEVL